jgi:hypothetical protein
VLNISHFQLLFETSRMLGSPEIEAELAAAAPLPPADRDAMERETTEKMGRQRGEEQEENHWMKSAAAASFERRERWSLPLRVRECIHCEAHACTNWAGQSISAHREGLN